MGVECDGVDADRCLDGVWVCEDSALVCTDDESTNEETCDGSDEDCDGKVDEDNAVAGPENPEQAILLKQVCGSDVGLCQQGIQTCIDGAFGVCANEVLAVPEVCDGQDNDCDGHVDNGFDLNSDTSHCGGRNACVRDLPIPSCRVDGLCQAPCAPTSTLMRIRIATTNACVLMMPLRFAMAMTTIAMAESMRGLLRLMNLMASTGIAGVDGDVTWLSSSAPRAMTIIPVSHPMIPSGRLTLLYSCLKC